MWPPIKTCIFRPHFRIYILLYHALKLCFFFLSIFLFFQLAVVFIIVMYGNSTTNSIVRKHFADNVKVRKIKKDTTH